MIVRQLITLLGYQTDNRGARDYEARLQSIAQTATRVAAVIAGLGTVVALAGDAMSRSLAMIESAIGRSATSASEAQGVYEELYQLSLRTGVGANESAEAFTRFNLAMRDLNRPASDTIALIEGLQASAIVAGVSTSDLTGTMIQLGQALASGKLQGDEMMRLRESMPQFLRETAQAMGMTLQQFMEASEKGLLTPARLVPAMLTASAGARRELANFPVTMDRSFRVLRNTVQRWLADFDKALGLSQSIARWFMAISRQVERWRGSLQVVERWVQRLGGMEQILRSAAGALAVFTAGVLAYRAAAIAAALAQALWLLPWIALGAAIVALGVLLADFVAWVSGEDVDTLFGSWFGDFDTFIAPFRAAWESLRDWLIATWQSISDGWNRFWSSDQMREGVRIMAGLASLLMEAWAPVQQFFADLWAGIVSSFEWAWEKVQPIVRAIQAAMAWMEDPLGRRRRAAGAGEGGPEAPGSGGSSGPVVPGAPIPPGRVPRGLSGAGRQPLYPRDLEADPSAGLDARMPGAPQVNANQNNTITIEQVIQATGVNPAEIAAAARTGVSQAGVAVGQTQADFARALMTANPRTEPATR